MNLVPIVVGVTGHRRLRKEDYPLLKEKVRQELKKIKDKAPDSPLVLLDSLALGGDALCAEVALELGYELEVPLPFEESEYRKDFDEENLKIFDEQKAKSSKVFELNKITDLKQRDDGYRDAGLYIATHSHIVLALWDGEKGKPGGCGSAEFVDFVREGFDQSLIIPTPFITIIHISAIREGKLGESGVVTYIERNNKCTDKLLSDTNNFNKDSKEKNLKEYSLLKEVSNEVVNDFHDLYKKADSLSSYYQDKYLKTMRTSSILGVGIVLSLLFYNQMGIIWLLVFYAVFPIISKIVVEKALKEKFLERYIEARCLAESCRVQIYLLLSGVNRSVGFAYPWSIREDNDWIIKAMMSKHRFTKNIEANSTSFKTLIEDQLHYHEKALVKEDKNNKKAKRSTKITTNITFINYAIVFVSEFIHLDLFTSPLFVLGTYSFTLKTLFKISLGILSAVAALLTNYYGKLSLSRRVEDHKRYIDLYKEVLKKIDVYDEELIWAVAKEEISENCSWRTYTKNNNPSVIIK